MGSRVAFALGKKLRINKVKRNNCMRQNLRASQIIKCSMVQGTLFYSPEFVTGPYSESNKCSPQLYVLLRSYCGVFAQRKNCGGRETAVAR
jgi:hypothetical protein